MVGSGRPKILKSLHPTSASHKTVVSQTHAMPSYHQLGKELLSGHRYGSRQIITCLLFFCPYLAVYVLLHHDMGSLIQNRPTKDAGSPLMSRNMTATTAIAGVIVLGMHRSGTSMLTGLLSLGCGYSTGDNLIPPRKHNAKGYFEREDVVLQNIEFFEKRNVSMMSPKRLRAYRPSNNITFLSSHGWSAIEFFNHKDNSTNSTIPWIQKDPRMCITLNEWLPHFETRPAILFTYRHPLEVARSLRKRDRMPIVVGLDTWMAYNEAIVQNTAGICLVSTNNDAILKNPIQEVSRIVHQLTTKCGVIPPPYPTPSKSVVDDFVDVNLQRSKREALPGCQQTFNGTAAELKSVWELRRYKQAMRLYCDIESGLAFASDYKIRRVNAMPI